MGKGRVIGIGICDELAGGERLISCWGCPGFVDRSIGVTP